jgi:thioredoxin reductase (NADPH)
MARLLGIKGEDRFMGRGISTCATCDAALYRNKKVAVVGGGDSAITEGLFLTRFADKVTLIHRRNELRAEKILQKKALESMKMDFIWDSVVEEVVGDEKIRSIAIKNIKTGAKSSLDIDGFFIYIGHVPNTAFIDVKKDPDGYIITDELMQTSIEGIFAAGDCRKTPLRQISTAVGDGATAAYRAEAYLENMECQSK